MDEMPVAVPVADAPIETRTAFLRKVAAWTFGGLSITAVISVLSALFVAPVVFRGGTWVVFGVVYGSMLLSQTLVRGMVYGPNKVFGFVLGTMLQGIALGFLLLVTMLLGAPNEGLALILQAAGFVALSAAAMLLYVSMAKHQFNMLGAGLSMIGIPMLLLMALQLVFPMNGTAGIVVALVFTVVSAGALLYRLNHVTHHMDATMEVEGGYEITLGIVVFFWNLLSLLNRLRRR